MQLLKYFHELTLHPANAKQLKALILQLAVQGKLTAQWRKENPDVEPAAKLLERVKAEKERLIKEKKIKKEKSLEPIESKESKSIFPVNWSHVRLGDIGDWGAGATPLPSNSSFFDGNINWFKSGELNDGIIDYDSEEKVTETALAKASLRLNKPGDVLIAMYGATIGKTALLNVTATTNQAVCACTCFSCITNLFLHLLLKALRPNFLDQGEGGAQPNISRIKIRQQVIGLPPLEEQKAIVETVDRLFKEVEQLEQLTESRIRIKEQFALSALRRLAENNTPQEWEALQPHFHTFFNNAHNIKKLRETILQLAVQGKLTARWRKVHPELVEGKHNAALLLQKIKAEKARLIAKGKIKKENPLPEISADEIPYELPEGWVWCRLGEIVIKLGAGSTPLGGKNSYLEDGIKFLRSQNVYNEGLRLQEVAFITEETHQKMSGTHVHPQDLLLNITGASIGRCALVPDDFDTANVSQHVSIIRLVYKSLRKYIHSLIISRQFQQTIMNVQVGVSREGLSMTKLKFFVIPLPPLSEQQAIVETVNRLMALCDSLEQEVISGTARAELWMKGAVREVMGEVPQ